MRYGPWLLVVVVTLVLAGSAQVPAQIAPPLLVVDGVQVTPRDPVMIRDGRVYVPLRFFAETMGADVRWDAATRTVFITRTGAAVPPAGGDVIVFVYIANRTGAEVQVKARADGRELFDRRLPAAAAPAPGVMPPPPPYPVLEMKIGIPRAVALLEIEEALTLRMRRTFNITGFDRTGAGFRITLTTSGIELAQDYRPIR